MLQKIQRWVDEKDIPPQEIHEISSYLQQVCYSMDISSRKKFLLREDIDGATDDELLDLLSKIFAKLAQNGWAITEEKFLRAWQDLA